MRPIALMLLPLAAIASAAAYDFDDRGPGATGVRQGDATAYAVRDFDRLAYGSAASAEVRVGPAWSVRATGPAEAIARLRVAQNNGVLEIGRRYREYDSDPHEREVRFFITLPALSKVALGGSSNMTIDRVTGERLGVAVGGSGSVRIGTLTVDTASISIGGSGNVATAGTVRSLTVSIGGSGSLDAPNLRAASATVSTAGSGSARADVAGLAKVSMVGGGRVDLGAGARCTITKMGGGSVRCGN